MSDSSRRLSWGDMAEEEFGTEIQPGSVLGWTPPSTTADTPAGTPSHTTTIDAEQDIRNALDANDEAQASGLETPRSHFSNSSEKSQGAEDESEHQDAPESEHEDIETGAQGEMADEGRRDPRIEATYEHIYSSDLREGMLLPFRPVGPADDTSIMATKYGYLVSDRSRDSRYRSASSLPDVASEAGLIVAPETQAARRKRRRVLAEPSIFAAEDDPEAELVRSKHHRDLWMKKAEEAEEKLKDKEICLAGEQRAVDELQESKAKLSDEVSERRKEVKTLTAVVESWKKAFQMQKPFVAKCREWDEIHGQDVEDVASCSNGEVDASERSASKDAGTQTTADPSIDDLLNDNGRLTQERDDCRTSKAKIKSTVRNQVQEIKDLQAENLVQQTTITALENTIARQARLPGVSGEDLDHLMEYGRKFAEDCHRLQAELESAQQRTTQLATENGELAKDNKEAESRLIQSEAQCTILAKQNTEMEQRRTTVAEQQEQLTTRERLEKELEAAQDRVERLDKEKESLQKESQEAKETESKRIHSDGQRKYLAGQMTQLHEQNSRLESLVEKLQTEAAEQSREHNEAASRLIHTKGQQSKLTVEHAQLQDDSSQLRSRVDQLETQNAEQSKEHKEAVSRLTHKEGQRSKLATQNAQLQEQNSQLETRINQVERQHVDLLKTSNEAESKLTHNEGERRRLKAQIAELQRQNSSIPSTVTAPAVAPSRANAELERMRRAGLRGRIGLGNNLRLEANFEGFDGFLWLACFLVMLVMVFATPDFLSIFLMPKH